MNEAFAKLNKDVGNVLDAVRADERKQLLDYLLTHNRRETLDWLRAKGQEQ